jgi:hypothetical protein
MATPQLVTIEVYREMIPPFVASELVRLYGNLFSTIEKWQACGVLQRASTYVVRDADANLTILLFSRIGGVVRVLNEFVALGAKDLNRFACHIFTTFTDVTRIDFGPIHPAFEQLDFPYLRANCTEDVVLSLPADTKTYLASIGRSTRQNINYYRNRLKRDHPSLIFSVQQGNAIDEQDFHGIIALSQARMEGKAKTHGFGEKQAGILMRMARQCGSIATVKIRDRLAAGTIFFRIADNFFLYVIAHDSAYNDYGLGTYCCFLTIDHCIAQNGRNFHFLWGREEYKYRLGGLQRDYDMLSLYRSRGRKFLQAAHWLRMTQRGWERQIKVRLMRPEWRGNAFMQTARRVVRTVRSLLLRR